MSRQLSALILIAFCLIASSIAINVPDTDSVLSPGKSAKLDYLQSDDFFNAKFTQAEKDQAAQAAAQKQQGGQGKPPPPQRRAFDDMVPVLLRRDVTESQKHEVAKNEAYRANLNNVNANVSN